jgi:hypothetical protein
MRKNDRKLTLNRDTLRSLNDGLSWAVGRDPSYSRGNTVNQYASCADSGPKTTIV